MGFKVASRVRGLSDEAFREAFGTKEQCRAALVRLRWPDGFVCPCCGHREHCVLAGRGLYQCNRCKKQTSPTAGTIFHATMLVTKALEDPLRRVTLLLRTVLILRQDLLDDTGERVELGPDPHIAGRHRETEHLLHCPRINPKMTSRFPLALPIDHHRVTHPRIQIHSLHPPPFAQMHKGLSLTEFYSGATRLSGRFNEGLLLRRSHTTPW